MNKLNQFIVTAACCLIFQASAEAEIYKWTDAQGVVHFSDKPAPGATEVTIQPVQSFSNPAPENTDAAAKPVEEEELGYKYIAITKPMDQETIRSSQGAIAVLVDLQPELRQGDTLQLLFDDKEIGKPQTEPMFSLSGVNRGSHSLAVQVMNADGTVLKKSDTISVFMQPPRVGMVPGTRP